MQATIVNYYFYIAQHRHQTSDFADLLYLFGHLPDIALSNTICHRAFWKSGQS